MSQPLRLFTIGFTKKSAERFFTLLRAAGVQCVLDVRLHNRSQLAGFSKRDDLAYFLRAILGIDYLHLPELAPTEPMLTRLRQGGTWAEYQASFVQTLQARQIEKTLDPARFAQGCLLCSEDQPEHCHRRLVAEYLAQHWPGLEIVHLV